MPPLSKILLRLPKPLHDAVKERALAEKTSMNSLLERYIAQGVIQPMPQETYAEVVRTAHETFKEHFVGLLLYGSKARGDAHDTSDTDLLLVVDNEIKIERSLYRTWDTILPADISIHIAHLPSRPDEAGSLWLECALDARILHDPLGRIAHFLSETKEYITSGNVVRRVTHGQGFWVSI